MLLSTRTQALDNWLDGHKAAMVGRAAASGKRHRSSVVGPPSDYTSARSHSGITPTTPTAPHGHGPRREKTPTVLRQVHVQKDCKLGGKRGVKRRPVPEASDVCMLGLPGSTPTHDTTLSPPPLPRMYLLCIKEECRKRSKGASHFSSPSLFLYPHTHSPTTAVRRPGRL